MTLIRSLSSARSFVARVYPFSPVFAGRTKFSTASQEEWDADSTNIGHTVKARSSLIFYDFFSQEISAILGATSDLAEAEGGLLGRRREANRCATQKGTRVSFS